VIHASSGRDEAVVLSLLGDPRRVVFTNRPPKSHSVSYVVSDNAGGATALTRHLLAKGHRKIGFIGGPSYARSRRKRTRPPRRDLRGRRARDRFSVHRVIGRDCSDDVPPRLGRVRRCDPRDPGERTRLTCLQLALQ
jgi:DNA-binding LacI/PurR family transcriptional regulator